MNKRKYASIVGMTVMLGLQATAQNMNSPYSVYGIGDIDNKPYNRTSGMGGAGLAIPSSYYLVDNNPAALAGLTKSFYLVDVAATGKISNYSGTPINADNSRNSDFWIKRISFATKINNFWASSIGYSQFSNVNYSFSGSRQVEGSTDNYSTQYQGDGGLNEFYWTNAVGLGRHFSIGLRSSILAGSINQTETIGEAGLVTKVQDYFAKPRFQAGFQYATASNKKWNFSLGGKYVPSIDMTSERTLTVSDSYSYLVEDKFIKNDRFQLPNTYAAGIAIKHKQKTTIAFDYSYEDWSSLKIREQGWQLISSSRLAGGIEISRQARAGNLVGERGFFQAGAFISNSYLQVKNEPINEFGFTAGMGGIIGRGLLYTVALEAGQRGTTQQKLIRETYLQATFSLTYRDFFLSKGRKYD